MGNRVVVMLSTDCAHEWEDDPTLGKKISAAAYHADSMSEKNAIGQYWGRVVEFSHCDNQHMVILDGSSTMYSLSSAFFVADKDFDSVALGLLRSAAAKFGYTLTKKRK